MAHTAPSSARPAARPPPGTTAGLGVRRRGSEGPGGDGKRWEDPGRNDFFHGILWNFIDFYRFFSGFLWISMSFLIVY